MVMVIALSSCKNSNIDIYSDKKLSDLGRVDNVVLSSKE